MRYLTIKNTHPFKVSDPFTKDTTRLPLRRLSETLDVFLLLWLCCFFSWVFRFGASASSTSFFVLFPCLFAIFC